MKDTIHIIGGGISGCSFAYFLKKDFDVIIYEKSPNLGGLMRTRYNLENIPWQQTSSILHTNKKWIIDLFNKFINLQHVEYNVAMNPLFDLRYYTYPFTKKTIDTMPWHWKEAILLDLEESNGEHSDNMETLITNFYGETVYDIFYKNYFKKLFKTNKITLTDWYKPFMRDVNSNDSHYNEENVLFPVNEGWNKLFDGLTDGVKIEYNNNKLYSDFNENDIVICTVNVEQFLELKTNLYSYGSFDIDSTPYKENSPDTMIYPNYTPYIYVTQYGKYFTKDDKNIIVKTFIDDGDQTLYPIPTKTNKKIYEDIIGKHNNVYFAGRAGSWSFMDIDNTVEQAQQMSAQIKHKRRLK